MSRFPATYTHRTSEGRVAALSRWEAGVIRFGEFSADLETGELHRNGIKVKLQGQPFEILVILLQRPGRIVTREELHKKLWPEDTFVDFEHGVNAAVNRLRDALGDSADSPQFIETMPRRGYRFIGTIEPAALVAIEPSRGEPSHPRWLKIAAGSLAILFCALGAVVAYRWPWHRPQQELAQPLSPLPLTALAGIETAPAFSPDGSRIVFAWNGDPESHGMGFDLYVKGIGSETLLRLTNHPSEWISAAWSPDGTQIAFHRIAGADTGLYVVPAVGGPERKLRSTRVPYSDAAPISWSPDGKWISFGDPLPTEPADRLFLLSLDTLEIRSVPHDSKCRHEAMATFSHSGNRLAYVCVHSTNELELLSIVLPDGAPNSVASFSNHTLGLTWAPDDSRLIFSQSGADNELYEVTLVNNLLRRLPLPDASWPAIPSTGGKLAYSSRSDSINIWRKDLLHPELPAVKLISSTRGQNYPQYSPDGKHIAFRSSRSGAWTLWISNADGTNLFQAGKLEAYPGHPSWSPDSQHIVFNSKLIEHDEPAGPSVRLFSTYIIDISERLPRKLVTNASDVSTPSWSRDSRWIYFRSHELFAHKLYRCPATGGEKILVSADPDAIGPLESSDGRTVYFAERELNALLKGVPIERPIAEQLADRLPRVSNWSLWIPVERGIYFVPADARRSVNYFDFATKQVHEVFKVDKDFDEGLSISPDGRYFLYSQIDEQNSDIMLVDHFR